MLVIALAASPRKNGNSEKLLDEVIDGLHSGGAEVKKYRTDELDIKPCTSCGECERLGRCVIEDAFQELYDQLITCDGVVFASPLYFMNVPAGGKALLDRCQTFWIAKHRLGLDLFGERKRLGLLVSCAANEFGPGGAPLFRGIEDTMTYVFDALGLEKMDSLLFTRVDSKDSIVGNLDALRLAREKGVYMASGMSV